MSDTEESVEVAQGLLVNIFIRLPAHTQLEPMAERLRSMLDMEEPKVQSIISRLKSMPIIQIGARVRKSAADRAAADFRRVGFLVDLRPVLSLEAKSDTQVDGNAYECPSCEAKVVLTEQGQCPECDVFVHKLSNDFLLRKKIATEERIRAQALVLKDAESRARKQKSRTEALLREQIRQEIEDELGVQRLKTSIFSGRAGLVRTAGLLLVVGGAFAGGVKAASIMNPAAENAKPKIAKAALQAESIEKLLQATQGVGNKLDGPSEADLGEPVMVPGSDDSLMSVAQQASPITQKTAEPGQVQGESGAGAGAASHSLHQAAAFSAVAIVAVPVTLKPELQAEMAQVLARMGHVQRAREVLKMAYDTPAAGRSAEDVLRLKLVDLQVEAFGVVGGTDGRVKAQLDAFEKSVAELPTPYWKTLALAQLGEILGGPPRFSTDNAIPYFQQANELARQIEPVEQREAATGELMVSMISLRLESAEQFASKGLWSHARLRVSEINAAYKQFEGSAFNRNRLAALNYKGQTLMGNYSHAREILENAMAQAEKRVLAERLPALRVWAPVLPAANPAAFHKLLTAAQAEVEALQLHPAKMQALGELALLQAALGKPQAFEILRKRAVSLDRLSPEAAAQTDARLQVQGLLALASHAHKNGDSVTAEGYLRRVAGHLLH